MAISDDRRWCPAIKSVGTDVRLRVKMMIIYVV